MLEIAPHSYRAFIRQPPLALTTRLLFRSARLNVAENYAFGLYVIGHLSLLRALLAPIGGMSNAKARIVIMGVELAYFCWAAKDFFEMSWWQASWRSLVAKVALVVFTVVIGILGALLVVLLPAILSGGPAVSPR